MSGQGIVRKVGHKGLTGYIRTVTHCYGAIVCHTGGQVSTYSDYKSLTTAARNVCATNVTHICDTVYVRLCLTGLQHPLGMLQGISHKSPLSTVKT